MPKTNTTKRSRQISASIAVVLALLTWSLRDHIPMFPGGGREETGDKVKLAKPQIYYGPANSIAVLPFTCTSPGSGDSPASDSGNETIADAALADGVAQSLIDLLAGIPGLQVTSSNSSFFFRAKRAAMSVRAEHLKVRHVLEGCARMTAGGVEISDQMRPIHCCNR
jgi:TolB-like protein